MKAYCPDCGSATEYSLSKPKFCASCGKSFSLTASAPVKKIFKPRARTVEPQIEIEEEEEFSIPDIDKLQVSIEASRFKNVSKIGDIMGSNTESDEEGFRREVDSSYSLETFEQDFMRDAGSSRKSDAKT
jgi:hypothetical protein|tara:strand:- start:6487 stop:6876 length:390 start_codon:yes stop_codon:yes gene_type:complete